MSAGAMSLKAQIRNLAKKKNIKAQVLLQNYMFERFLERLSLSEHKDRFVLKGGMLIAAIVGMDMRSTMDLDAMLRGLSLTEEGIRNAISEICSFPVQDEIKMTLGAISPIRADDVYGGYRVKITSVYDTIETPFSVDISTGDVESAELRQQWEKYRKEFDYASNITYEQYGRNGQRQNGIDMYSDTADGKRIVAQCKNYHDDVKKFINTIKQDIEDAKTKFDIDKYIVMTSLENDTTMQNFISALTVIKAR